jgi:hypothetical protein
MQDEEATSPLSASLVMKLLAYYSNVYFQINCWHSWRETQSSEDQFIQSIGTVFGKDVILAYGTWSSWSRIKGLAPSPTTGL